MERRWVVSPDYRSIIDAVVRARQDLGVSQRELARRLGKHPSFTNKIEKLERRLDVLEFIAIAQALGVEPPKLLAQVTAELSHKVRV